MSSKDIRLIIRVKNNRLAKAREKLGLCQSAMAKQCGVGVAEYGEIENLKKFPILKDGSWNTAAQNISSFIGIVEEELFPQALESIRAITIQKEIGFDQLEYVEKLQLEGPVELLQQRGTREAIEKIVEELTPREQKVINMIYGINGESEHTREEVGEEFYVTSQRVRQIEAKALRKLRHPGRGLYQAVYQ